MFKDVIHAKIESLFLCGQSLKRNNVDRQINYTLEVINILVDAGASLYSRDVRQISCMIQYFKGFILMSTIVLWQSRVRGSVVKEDLSNKEEEKEENEDAAERL